MHLPAALVPLISLLTISAVHVSAHPKAPSSSPSVSVVYSWPVGSWAENVAVRKNGNILVNRLDVPELWEVDPKAKDATLVHRFDDSLSLLGITEVTNDLFAVVVSNFSLASFATGTSAIWTVDLDKHGRKAAKVEHIATLTEAVFLNGLTTLSSAKGTVLVSDSSRGVVFRVDIDDGSYAVVLKDETMAPPPNQTLPIGINGIRTRGKYLYYTNTQKVTFSRVALNSDGTAAGPYETVYTEAGPPFDDFAISKKGVAYVMHPFSAGLTRITPDGQGSLILGGENKTLGSTSGAFDRDGETLYVVTSGGLAAGQPGPAYVLAVDGLS